MTNCHLHSIYDAKSQQNQLSTGSSPNCLSGGDCLRPHTAVDAGFSPRISRILARSGDLFSVRLTLTGRWFERPDVLPSPRRPLPQARHYFTTLRQVNQLIEASEAEPDRSWVHGAAARALLTAAHQSTGPRKVRAVQRAVHACHGCRGQRCTGQNVPVLIRCASSRSAAVNENRSRISSGAWSCANQMAI